MLRFKKKGAYFLSRYKFGVNIYDDQTGEKIDLVKILRKKGSIDQHVKLGCNQTLSCRLIAVPLPEKVIAERKRKARADRCKTANHSDKYFELLGYCIYITNVPKEIWSVEQITKAYRARWYIEILFKGWKSNLKMKVNIYPKGILLHKGLSFSFMRVY